VINQFKETIKRVFDLYNYEESVKINEIKYLVEIITQKNLNKKSCNHADFGGGNGLYSYRLLKNGLKSEVTVIDYYVDGQFGFKHIKKPLENLQIDKKFDTISCMLVIDLVENRKAVLSQIKQHLKANGVCFISIPNHNSININLWKENAKKSNNQLAKVFLKYQEYYTPKLLNEELKEFDMKVVTMKENIFLPSYATDPKIRWNRKIYEHLDKKLSGFIEPSYYICTVEHL